jgi:hypothetical protein
VPRFAARTMVALTQLPEPLPFSVTNDIRGSGQCKFFLPLLTRFSQGAPMSRGFCETWDSSPSCLGEIYLLQNLPIIDAYGARFSVHVSAKTAPSPLVGFSRPQTSLDRIAMPTS